MKLQAEIFRNYNEHLSSCIGVYENVIPRAMCVDIIKYYNDNVEYTTRTDEEHMLIGADKPNPPRPIDAVQYQSLQLIGDPREESKNWVDVLTHIIYPYGPKFERYLHSRCHDDHKPYDKPMSETNKMFFRSLQIQKYTPTDSGYPAVHIEDGPGHTQKYLAVILYLNDIDSHNGKGGETVFPMGGRVIEPEAGLLAIWPSSLPFYHCGRPTKIDKYIITTWFEFE